MANYWPNLKLDLAYIAKPVRDRLVDLGLAETEPYNSYYVYGGERKVTGYRTDGARAPDGKGAAIEGRAPAYAEVHVAHITQRGMDLLGRKMLVNLMSILWASGNKWVAFAFVAISVVWQVAEATCWLVARLFA